jgi:hypothetical protein
VVVRRQSVCVWVGWCGRPNLNRRQPFFHYVCPPVIYLALSRDKLPSPVERLSHLWRRNVAAFAPTLERCRFPGKRCRFEDSISLLIVETGLRFVALVLSRVVIIMSTLYHRIPKGSRLYNSVQTVCGVSSCDRRNLNRRPSSFWIPSLRHCC